MLFRTKRRLDGMEEDIRSLKRDFQALELEWSNVYDKLRKAMGRIVKSRAIIEAKEAPEEEEATSGQGTPLRALQGTPSGFLSPRQREIQQQILRRRAGG